MANRYYISEKGADVVANRQLPDGPIDSPASDIHLLLGVLDTEYSYSGPEGKTVRQLKRELFAGPDSWSEDKIHRLLEALYSEGYVDKTESEKEDYPHINQHYGYRRHK